MAEQREAARIRKRNQEIAEADRNAAIAKQTVEIGKRIMVQDFQKEKDIMWREKEKEEQIELDRKKALIREIRALEAERIEDRNFQLQVKGNNV